MTYIGNKIFLFDAVKSTQEIALSLVRRENNRTKNVIILSRTQSNGKGRMERKWHSPYGGLWFSLILKPNIESSMITIFPLIAGISICETISEMTEITPKLKWPNDVLISDKKVAGIVIDAELDKHNTSYIIMGIGININFNINKITIENFEYKKDDKIQTYPITTLKDENNNNEIEINKFLGILLKKIDKWQKEIKNNKKVIKKYLEYSHTIGRRIQIFDNKGAINNGMACNIDNYGALVVKLENGKFQKIDSDVSIRYIE